MTKLRLILLPGSLARSFYVGLCIYTVVYKDVAAYKYGALCVCLCVSLSVCVSVGVGWGWSAGKPFKHNISEKLF